MFSPRVARDIYHDCDYTSSGSIPHEAARRGAASPSFFLSRELERTTAWESATLDTPGDRSGCKFYALTAFFFSPTPCAASHGCSTEGRALSTSLRLFNCHWDYRLSYLRITRTDISSCRGALSSLTGPFRN